MLCAQGKQGGSGRPKCQMKSLHEEFPQITTFGGLCHTFARLNIRADLPLRREAVRLGQRRQLADHPVERPEPRQRLRRQGLALIGRCRLQNRVLPVAARLDRQPLDNATRVNPSPRPASGTASAFRITPGSLTGISARRAPPPTSNLAWDRPPLSVPPCGQAVLDGPRYQRRGRARRLDGKCRRYPEEVPIRHDEAARQRISAKPLVERRKARARGPEHDASREQVHGSEVGREADEARATLPAQQVCRFLRPDDISARAVRCEPPHRLGRCGHEATLGGHASYRIRVYRWKKLAQEFSQSHATIGEPRELFQEAGLEIRGAIDCLGDLGIHEHRQTATQIVPADEPEAVRSLR